MLRKWITWTKLMNNHSNKVEEEVCSLKITLLTIEVTKKKKELKVLKVFTTLYRNLRKRSFNNNFTNHKMALIEVSNQREKPKQNWMMIPIWNPTTKSKLFLLFNLIYLYLQHSKNNVVSINSWQIKKRALLYVQISWISLCFIRL